ncbi:MAG TPA: uracil-DNA glycosylase family protein [Candidatus Limnocylindrales bacterium]|nr:uracil-DNA glycosylase family protein [Candidatus Limnocylindrales bacterium]
MQPHARGGDCGGARLLEIADELCAGVGRLRFGGEVEYVYNPLSYARAGYAEYVGRYGGGRKEVVLVGMNPGPFGMTQTGVPFGHVPLVRDWLGIRAQIGRPPREHPKRPVLGFDCTREEVSGARLWGWARTRFGTPARFFGRFFVLNYCPLVFLEKSGRNRTPDKLPPAEKIALFAACDRALAESVACLAPRHVIGIGRFATERILRVLTSTEARLGCIPHPSPASPAANRDWAGAAERELRALGIALP